MAKLCKSGLPSAPTQYVLENEGDELMDKFVDLTRSRVEARIRATEPHILQRKPFNLEKFFGGKGWEIVERIGQRSGSNLDAGKIVPKDYLKKGEFFVNGEERLRRIKAEFPSDPQIDGQDFLALYEEEGQLTLRWLYDTKGITWLSCWGVILRSPNGNRSVLDLCRRDDGSWRWCYNWVASRPAAVLAS